MAEEIQEVFSDVFSVHVSPWSSAISFGIRGVSQGEQDKYNVRVRMSLEQAKALAVIMRRSIRQYEDRTGTKIELPRDLLNQLGIGPEDWGL